MSDELILFFLVALIGAVLGVLVYAAIGFWRGEHDDALPCSGECQQGRLPCPAHCPRNQSKEQ